MLIEPNPSLTFVLFLPSEPAWSPMPLLSLSSVSHSCHHSYSCLLTLISDILYSVDEWGKNNVCILCVCSEIAALAFSCRRRIRILCVSMTSWLRPSTSSLRPLNLRRVRTTLTDAEWEACSGGLCWCPVLMFSPIVASQWVESIIFKKHKSSCSLRFYL